MSKILHLITKIVIPGNDMAYSMFPVTAYHAGTDLSYISELYFFKYFVVEVV